MSYDVVAIGEPIIDFVPRAASSAGNLQFEAFVGGGACNVLSQVAAFGGSSALIGAVGHDVFGDFLIDKLNRAGVETQTLHRTTIKNTGIGFVHLSGSGERSFTFYRNPEAPVELFLPEDEAIVATAKIFHFTSVSLPGPSIRESTFAAIGCARSHGVTVSFDVNYRANLWNGEGTEAKKHILRGIALSDIVKLSEEERGFLFGKVSNQECAAILHQYGVTLVAVSMGSEGSYFSYPGGEGVCSSSRIRMVDSTGCGDAFAGTLLAQIALCGTIDALKRMPIEALKNVFTTANAAGALCASRYGSFTVMPTKKEIIDFLPA